MSFWKKIIIINLLIIFTLFLKLEFAKADAWWGKGARDENWVLKHGGSIIYYKIKGKTDSDRYTVKMFLEGKKGAGGGDSDEAKKGDLIEIEYGSEAVFDDAINNKYKLRVYRSDDKKISAEVTVKPGEITRILFDLYEDEVFISKEIVYKNHQIKLNSESSKWIDPAQLKPAQNIISEEAREKAEKEKQEELERKKAQKEKEELEKQRIQEEIEKQEKLKLNFDSLKKEIDSANQKIEKNLLTQKENNKKIFRYLVSGPDKDNLKKIEEKISQNKKKLKEIEIIEESLEEKNLIKNEKEELLISMEKYSLHLARNKHDLNFWNRLKSVFNMS